MSDGRNPVPRDLVDGFGPFIKEQREKLGWSRHRLAREAEIGMTTVCDIEDERRSPSLRVAMKLIRALQCDAFLSNPARQVQKERLDRRTFRVYVPG